MWFQLIFLLLLVAIALRQTALGLSSGLIMVVLSTCCAAAALGSYEWIAVHWLAPYWKPSYACAVALAASFGIPLILLRAITDRLIRRSSLLPSLVDRIGGGTCGLITAFILVGVMAHAVQMVPFGPSIIGFSRVDVPSQSQEQGEKDLTPPDPYADQHELWLAPDRFVVGLASMVSSGVFSGPRLLSDDHPDLVEEVGWQSAAHPEVSRYAPPRSISIVRTERVPFLYGFREANPRINILTDQYEPKTPTPGRELQMIRVKLGRAARDKYKSHLFTLRQFRLVGRLAGEDDVTRQYFPVAIQQVDSTQQTNRHIQTKWTRWGAWPVVDEVYSPRKDNKNEVEIVFELPPNFKPLFLEYKKAARVAVSFEAPVEGEPPPPPAQTEVGSVESAQGSEQTPPERKSRRPRRPRRSGGSRPGGGGRVRGLAALPERSFFGGDMPVSLQTYRKLRNVETSRGELTNGHLVAYLDEQDAGKSPAINKFHVPSDKRLLHLNTGHLQARSGVGGALSRAVAVAQNYIVTDSQGRQYKVIGKYAIADVEGRQIMEIQYFPEQAGTIGGLGEFDHIKDRHLTGRYELVTLFLVEPGAKIVSFSTGGSASRRDDLKEENLVAPQ